MKQILLVGLPCLAVVVMGVLAILLVSRDDNSGK